MIPMHRRSFLQVTGLSVAAFAGASFAASSDKQRPNLLIIQTDEHNFRTLGCYRKTLSPEQAFMWGKDAVVETPNIDWLDAFTGRYKLVVSPKDPPWLIDMQKDPDELKNFCPDPSYREITRGLAKALLSYGKEFNDERVSERKILQDLTGLLTDAK